MKKTLLTIALISTTSLAHAIDFANYVPTLGDNAGYSLSFSKVVDGSVDFVYYTRNADDSLTPVYYKISDPVKNESATFLGVIDTDQGGDDINGNFWGLEPALTSDNNGHGAIYNQFQFNIGNITGDFVDNIAGNSGGAIYNKGGSIGNIIGDFVDNSANGGGGSYNDSTILDGSGISIDGAGGAIINGGIIGNITGNFIGNSASSTGGAIYNAGMRFDNIPVVIGDIKGDFIGNSASVNGGAIYNGQGTIGDITGDFISNSAGEYGWGGAIENNGGAKIGDITGDFIGNSASYDGGAILNYGIIGDITGDFIGNSAGGGGLGGAIYNEGSTIGDITGDFIGNSASVNGGAILNYGTIGDITGDFIGNSVGEDGLGGAILNGGIFNTTISGSFIGNHIGNRISEDNRSGGAIFTSSKITFLADGRDNFFTGNYAGTKGSGEVYNAIYADYAPLTFQTAHEGNFVFDDNIDGENYDINITGDNTGRFFLNNDIIGATNINVSDTTLVFGEGPYGNGRILASATPKGEGIITPAAASPAVTNLRLTNAILDLHNNYFETVSVKNYTSVGNNELHIDISSDWQTDVLRVEGNLEGETKVVIHGTETDNTGIDPIKFVEAPNDLLHNPDAFKVFRVYGNPYMWKESPVFSTGTEWYLVTTDVENPDSNFIPDPEEPEEPELPIIPDPDPEIEINPEIIAYRALHSIGIEQTRSMVNNIRSKVAANKVLPDTCLLVVNDTAGNHNAWVNPIYHTANIDAPVEIEADIWGLEAGFDLQANRNHKFGIFASYRQGEYDLNGKGEEYFSEVGSQIDIDSYMAGLYYRYDYRHLWAFATAHGGVQKADIETNDGVTSDTDGTEVGASAEMGYLFNLSNTLKLEPSLGVFYTEIDFDDAESTYGTNASWDKIRQTEVEAGVKLEKYFEGDYGFTKAYIKPSVIQVITNGDEVRITGLNKISTYEDGTLGRIELGMRHAITNALSAYGFVNYTFGSDYDATSLGAGLSYSW